MWKILKKEQKGLQNKLRSNGDVKICLRLLTERRQTELVAQEQDVTVVSCKLGRTAVKIMDKLKKLLKK